MKTLRMVFMTLLFSLIVSGACAGSILPMMTPVPTAAPTAAPAAPVYAPSYGMMANVEADEVGENAQGGIMLTLTDHALIIWLTCTHYVANVH